MSNNKDLKEKLLNLAERSTFHAIPNIVQSDRKSMKLIWIVCLLISATYCATVLITNIIEFLKFEVETVIKIDRESDAEFPTVTICYVQVCSDTSTSYQIEKDLVTFLTDANFSTQYKGSKSILETTKELFKSKTYYNGTLRELLKKYNESRSIKDYLISCQYSSEYCYENDFEYFHLGEFQRCFKFNSGKTMNNEARPIRKARRYGKNYGLQLELVVGLPDRCNLPLVSTSGLILYVHNSTYTIGEDTSAIQLSPGTETNIAIDRTFVNKLPDPYSDCVDNRNERPNTFASPSIERTFQLGKNYTQQTCYQLCFQNYLVSAFGCFDDSLPRTYEQERAANGSSCPKLIDTLEDTRKKPVDSSGFYKSEDTKCLAECPTECEYVTYDTTISSSQFPTITYNDILVKNENVSGTLDTRNKEKVDYELIKNSILSVNVFYRSDMFKRIKENPSIETEIFVSNIGGALGLFLGISILSIVEIIEIVCEILIALFTGKLQNNRTGIKMDSNNSLDQQQKEPQPQQQKQTKSKSIVSITNGPRASIIANQ